MPSPNLVKTTAITRFQSFGITLPAAAGAPPPLMASGPAGAALAVRPAGRAMTVTRTFGRQGTGSQGSQGSQAPPTGTPMTQPPALFRAASNAVADVDLQKAMHDGYSELIDALTDSLRAAWDAFRAQAYFQGVRVNALTALGTQGCLRGPVLYDLIRTAPRVASWIGWKMGVRDAFADGVDKMWSGWQRQVTVPGLPWYPTFVAWPGPQAPPTPNVPMPLATCVSTGLHHMSPGELKASLTLKLSGKMDYHAQFADAMSGMIATAFTIWLPSQMVQLVMGKGPVPTFAPPYVPVGPVVNGTVLPNPGCLAS